MASMSGQAKANLISIGQMLIWSNIREQILVVEAGLSIGQCYII